MCELVRVCQNLQFYTQQSIFPIPHYIYYLVHTLYFPVSTLLLCKLGSPYFRLPAYKVINIQGKNIFGNSLCKVFQHFSFHGKLASDFLISLQVPTIAIFCIGIHSFTIEFQGLLYNSTQLCIYSRYLHTLPNSRKPCPKNMQATPEIDNLIS